MVQSRRSFLDLVALRSHKGMLRLSPSSVHGVLWLQTHFPEQHWDDLAAGEVAFSQDCIDELFADARQAGLSVETDPVLS